MSENTRRDASREAMDWLHLLHGDSVDADLARKFEGWLAVHPDNVAAYAECERMWRELEFVPELAETDLSSALSQGVARERVWSVRSHMAGRIRGRRRVPAGIVAGLVAALALVVIVPVLQDDPTLPVYATAIAEIRDVTLPDGSVVTLGARSKIETAFTPESRRVTLSVGEAFFSVTKDEARPFLVDAGDTVVRVVGTQFDVKRSLDTVHVSVLEGVVEVLKADDAVLFDAMADAPKQVLTAGEMVVAAKAAPLPPVAKIEPDLPGTWRSGRLVYRDASLAEIIADANRYYGREIRFGSDDLKTIRLTTAFRTDQIDDMLSGLELSQPIRIDREGNDRLTLYRAAR